MLSGRKKEKTENEGSRLTGFEIYDRTRTVIGVVLVIASVIIGVLVVASMGRRPDPTQVLVAKQTIPQGVRITEENAPVYFGIRSTTDPSGSMLKASGGSSVYGMFTRYSVLAGSDILSSYFTDLPPEPEDTVPDGMELIALKVPSANAFVGFIPKVGDVIRFYCMKYISGDDDVPSERFIDGDGLIRAVYRDEAEVYELLQYVEIYALLDSGGNDVGMYNLTHDEDINTSILVVMVTQEQAKQIIEMEASGSPYVTLISSGDPVRREELLAEQNRIIARYRAARELTGSVERYEAVIPLNAFVSAADYVPRPGDTVCFRHILRQLRPTVAADGSVEEGVTVSFDTPSLLSCVRVTNVYDGTGTTVDLSSYTGAASEKDDLRVGLALTAEQVGCLSGYLTSGERMYLVRLGDSGTNCSDGYDRVDSVIRALRLGLAGEDGKKG